MAVKRTIRPMCESDLGAVMKIEQESFADAWSSNEFTYELRRNPLARYIVMEENEVITGFAGLWLMPQEAHITNIAVCGARRRRGGGMKLMGELLCLAQRECDAQRVTLEVREGNRPAIALYEKLGFRAYEKAEDYYDDSEAAYLMELCDIRAALRRRG